MQRTRQSGVRSELRQELQHRIARLEAADRRRRRGELFQCTLFHIEICLHIAVGRFNALVAEPQCDHSNVHASLQ
jgi:hypothetical protein